MTPGVVRVYHLQDATLTWQYKEDLTTAYIRLNYGRIHTDNLLMVATGDQASYINESYTNRLTHSVTDSTVSYRLQGIENRDATGGFYGVEINGARNTDAFIFIYCKC